MPGSFPETFGGRHVADGIWTFDLDAAFNGGFGGTNGGVLAALCVFVARDAAPGRIVCGVDARFIRSFRPGRALIAPTVLNAGRTLTTVNVDILDEDEKLATRGVVSLAAPDALADVDVDPDAGEALAGQGEGKPWRHPKSGAIPLIDTFKPVYLGKSDKGVATGVEVGFDDDAASAEAACIAADISLGPPVAGALRGRPLAMPNPDIGLRFTGAKLNGGPIVAHSRLQSLVGGLATTTIEVRDGDRLLALGAASTTCLKT